MKDKMQTFGKAMLVPISLVAIGGLLLGIGGAFTNQTTIEAFGINWATYSQSFGFIIFAVIKSLGSAIFDNLSILYAIGVAFSLAKAEKGSAAFGAGVAYLAMQSAMSTVLAAHHYSVDNTTVEALVRSGLSTLEASKRSALFTTELGFFTYRTGVFGGVVMGLLVSVLHNRFYKTTLPTAFAFFSGTRTVPILSLIAGGILGIIFAFVWPAIGYLFGSFSELIASLGVVGSFLYRFVDECLVPFGMHPLLDLPLRWTQLGGSLVVDGHLVVGNSAILLAQLASPDHNKLLSGVYMAGMGVINFAIFPGIAVAMYSTALPENREKVAGLLIPTIISTTLFGITEPILFTFLFIAPWLYFGVYAPIAGLAEALCDYTKVSIYQGNIKDWIPFFLRPEKLDMWPYIYIWPLFFVISFFVFRTLILKFNILTPGREADPSTVKLYSKQEYNDSKKAAKAALETEPNRPTHPADSLALRIIEGLGGRDNIVDVDNCISRLRVLINDQTKVADDAIWKNELEALGVVRLKNAVQIIYGAKVCSIAVEVREELGGY